MTQEATQITTTPPLPGLQLVQDLNKALETLGTDFAGSSDPAALAWPYATWADTGTGTIKRRNAANSAWVIEGRLFRSHLPMYAPGDVPVTDIGPIYIIGTGPAEWDGSAYKALLPDMPTNDDLQWLGKSIGERFDLDFNAPTAPKDDPRFRFIILTAGLSGPGGYNEGVLVNESISGTAPFITATAQVDMPGSPLHGNTVRLINTSREFLRPGVVSDAPQSDMILQHDHSNALIGPGGSAAGASGASYTLATAGAVSGPSANRVGNESRPRNTPAQYLMRIK